MEPDPTTLEGQYAVKLKQLLEQQQKEVEQMKEVRGRRLMLQALHGNYPDLHVVSYT